jgi:hypothetical protein
MRARPSFLWVVGIADAQKDDLRFDLSVQAAPLEPSLPVLLLSTCRSASPKAPAPLHPFEEAFFLPETGCRCYKAVKAPDSVPRLTFF